jgi:hypothetical protein
MIHRIMRAPEKRIYYINVGNLPPNEIEAFMQKTINKLKKTPHVDERTGEYNLKFNMQNMIEDFYIPVRGNDSATKIDTTKGLEYSGMDDVAYIRDKLFAALKVPKAFMGYEKDLEGKCIDPETLIPLLDGRTLTVKEIINEFNEGKKNYVYSLDESNNSIVPGEIEWAGFTRLNTQTIKVWLDNEKYIRCTPDHKFLTREGIWKEAQNLIEGESLMPYKEYKNHKVLRIEKCNDLIDTCDLTIKDYHNFGTEAGVIIHNSTLAAQDIRFARTIERIQRIVLSELTKIALVHLYTQGYDEGSLTNFELSLTTPSIIYDQEKVALLKEKAELANTIIENNLISSDWVLENVFHFSEDEYANYRAQQIEDAKREFRLTQIKNEGNDPVETGKSYGTPHDLASLYGHGRYGEVPQGYDEKEPVGRPKEKASDINTQDNAFGKDRSGVKGIKDQGLDKQINPTYKNNSPLALENYIKSLKPLKNKKLLIENETNSLLDESKIKGL